MCELHIFAITSPPGGVHIFAWPANFRNFAPKPCIFSHTIPVRHSHVQNTLSRGVCVEVCVYVRSRVPLCVCAECALPSSRVCVCVTTVT